MARATLIRNIEDLPESLRSGCLTIGNFDGVHRGHARIIERLVSWAGQSGGPVVVFTFDPHPAYLLRPDKVPPPLTWLERKLLLLSDLGVDVVVAYPTDEAVLRLSPQQFFQQIVCDRLAARVLVEGPNFFFGQNRTGTIDLLGHLCHEKGIALEVVQPLVIDGRYVSSSRIRDLIRDGRVGDARQLLTKPYRVRGQVVHGAARGASIGFPTANIEPAGMVLPPLGVYAGRGFTKSETYPAAIHLGPNPTFGDRAVKFEVHLVGFDNELYGQTLEVEFLDRLRDVHPFEDVGALQRQLAEDVRAARSLAEADSSEIR